MQRKLPASLNKVTEKASPSLCETLQGDEIDRNYSDLEVHIEINALNNRLLALYEKCYLLRQNLSSVLGSAADSESEPCKDYSRCTELGAQIYSMSIRADNINEIISDCLDRLEV